MNREELQVDDIVAVWQGAFTGSPGIPPENCETRECILGHFNDVGQAYVFIRSGVTGSGNAGQYVFLSAIVRVVRRREGVEL